MDQILSLRTPPVFTPAAPASDEPAGVDVMAEFIAGVRPSNGWTANVDMRAAYVATCRENGEHPKSQQAFSKALAAARFERRRIDGRVEWRLPAARLAVVANG